jgi:hypothetical protein
MANVILDVELQLETSAERNDARWEEYRQRYRIRKVKAHVNQGWSFLD